MLEFCTSASKLVASPARENALAYFFSFSGVKVGYKWFQGK